MNAIKGFRTGDPVLLDADLRRQQQSTSDVFARIAREKNARWNWRQAVTAHVVAQFDDAILVSSATTLVRLPSGSLQDAGKRVLIALSGPGNVTVRAVSASVNGSANDALTDPGAIVYDFNGSSWWRSPGQGPTVVVPAPNADGQVMVSAGGVWTLLSPGTESDVLTIVSGAPAWSARTPGRLSVEADTVALWHGDDSLADSGPNGFTLQGFAGGVLGSGTIRYTHMFPGYRTFFLRTVDRLATTAVGSALRILGDMTIEFLLFIANGGFVGSGNQVIYHGTDSVGLEANNNVYDVRVNTATSSEVLVWSQRAGSPGADAIALFSNDVPSFVTPFYVAFTRASQVVTPYLQGVQAGTPSTTLTAPTGGTNGRLVVGGTNHESFAIAEIRISNTVRSTAQIKAAYNTLLGPVYGRLP